jgi:hypothetical protein
VRFRRQRDPDHPSRAEVYDGLRQQVLRLSDQLDHAAFADAPILVLLMETGYAEAVARLVAVVDGTTSLYFSNGGGIVGAGTHATVVEASRRWLEAGQTAPPLLAESTDPPLPGEGMSQFVAVTPDGLRAAVAPEKELGEREHALSPLFFAAHDVITQIRLVESR